MRKHKDLPGFFRNNKIVKCRFNNQKGAKSHCIMAFGTSIYMTKRTVPFVTLLYIEELGDGGIR